MENINVLKQVKTLGQINSVISASGTIDEAIKGGLKEILTGLEIDYAVLWYQDKKGDGNLHPYYWIAPVDLTKKQYVPGQGIVGTVFSTQETVSIPDYQNHRDTATDSDFEGINIASMVCVPLFSNHEDLGCIQFINAAGNHMITEDEAGVCELLCMLTATLIDEKSQAPDCVRQDRKPVMRVRDIHKEFHSGDVLTRVLNGVNLDIYEGEFLVVLGESGCGKSTFLNILGGLDSATSGTCSYYNEKITSYSQDQLTEYRRKNIGFVFQNYNLMPNLTVKQNLDLIGELVEDPMDSIEALKLVGLEEKRNSYPNRLSGGQQQRVSIARALVKRPRIIFADEPTAALDYSTSIEVLEVLENVMKTGTTLVMVTHNEEISRMANRVVRMRNGKIHEITVNRHPAAAGELVW